MQVNDLKKTLEGVRAGTVSVEAALAAIATEPFRSLGYANVDHHRALRCGFPEVIFGLGKTPEQVVGIMASILERDAGCLATRVNDDQARAAQERWPDVEFDPVGRTLWKGAIAPSSGRVVVVTAGTGDLPVAREAYTTARVMGCDTQLLCDVGVAGLHRLLGHLSLLVQADALVVIAGMEGALPSVVGGLVACPVIAVPTSVGYGASFGGVSALLSMLNSCAANVTVVNIDAGFCGGFVAGLIARRVDSARTDGARQGEATKLKESSES